MKFANRGNVRVLPGETGQRATCPGCDGVVISKCGEINTNHWAHESGIDCDSFIHENESQWHIDWKNQFPDKNQEVRIGPHRADVKYNGIVVEFQSSGISSVEIYDREFYYGKMIWVLDGYRFSENLNIAFRSQFNIRKDYVEFRWKHPRKSWWSADALIYIDLPTYVLEVRKIHENIPCGGWGYLIPKDEFNLKRVLWECSLGFKHGYEYLANK